MNASRPPFRNLPTIADAPAVERIVAATKFFNPAEVRIARELVEERLARGEASGYFFLFADDGEQLVGYSCFGPIDGTASSFDLFWIAVDPSRQGTGLGRRLMAASEREIAAMGGTRVYVETSSREQYAPTRAFYLACGYQEVALLPEFYGPGDGKVIFCRVV